jgi:hypothetical protein
MWAKHKDKIMSLIMSIIGTYGIYYLLWLKSGNELSYHMIYVFIFAAIYFIWMSFMRHIGCESDRKRNKKRIGYAAFVSLLFAVTMIMGYQLQARGMTESGFAAKGMILLRGICLSAVSFPIMYAMFVRIERISCRPPIQESKRWNSKSIFFISWVSLFLCWIPVFLAFYPAILAYDFHRQVGEVIQGFIYFNNMQPLIHTWLIWVAIQIGTALGSYEIGMAFYSIFQMLVASVILGYSCTILYRLTKCKWAVFVTAIFYGIFPYNSVLSVGATKDVLFGVLFLLFILLYCEINFFTHPVKQKNVLMVLWVMEGILMLMFRNNALYAMALFIVLGILLLKREQKVRILVLGLILLLGGKLALEGIQLAIGTQGRGSKSEMYSVLIQQFARVGYYHKDDMDADSHALVNRYVTEKYWEYYNAPLADTVKAWVAVDNYNNVWKGHMGQVIADWAKLGLRYPNEYIDAFLALTSGYWFWDDVSFVEVYQDDVGSRKGAVSTYYSSTHDFFEGVKHESKFPQLETLLVEIVSENRFMDCPVVSVLFKPAFYVWMLCLLFLAFIYTRQRDKLFLLLLPLCYFATMLLGPVVQVRYVYPLMIVCPLFLGLFYWKRGE